MRGDFGGLPCHAVCRLYKLNCGRKRGENGIYSVPIVGGATRNIVEIVDNGYAGEWLFYKKDALYYTVDNNKRSSQLGLYKYENGAETLLAACNYDTDDTRFLGRPKILNVNDNRVEVIFVDSSVNDTLRGITSISKRMDMLRNMVKILDAGKLDECASLSPVSDGYVWNAFYSPDETEIAQIETEGSGAHRVVVKNAATLEFLAEFRTDSETGPIGPAPPSGSAVNILPSVWTDNGYIVVSRLVKAPLLFKVIQR
ncbi:MAG: hypothetical protein LBR98_08095 [Syntrophomonadaceae bacterium]|jgi:hypothetical protein|nr:hypothetical protein [Syntrophomonadaceae bacterium]